MTPPFHPSRSPHDTRRYARICHGFTLVELMLVVIILGIFAALAVPYASSASRSRLPAAMRILEADLAFAQTHNIAKQSDPCIIIFDLTNNAYYLASASAPETPLTHPGDKQPYRIQYGQGRAAALTGIRLKAVDVGDDKQLTFGNLGQLDQTTAATITLTDGSSDLTIHLDPVTGLGAITIP